MRHFFIISFSFVTIACIPSFGQKFPQIEFTPFKDTLTYLDPLFVKLAWSNRTPNNIYYPHPDTRKIIQVRRISPNVTEWRNRTMDFSDIGFFGTSDDNTSALYIPSGYSNHIFLKVGPELYPDEIFVSKGKTFIGFQPGTYHCKFIYLHQGTRTDIQKCKECFVIEFTFEVLDSPPADEAALYDFLIKNDLANYIHHHRYAPENIPLFEEALLLAPETSSLKPFIHQAVSDLLTRQLYNAPKPYSDEELAALYERIVYHMRKVVESKHPYLLQNLSTDLSNYQFELQAVNARLRRK